MFNLGILTTTALLTMGVANATPIYNAKKNAPIPTLTNDTSSQYVSEYEIYLAQTNYSSNLYANKVVTEGYQGTDYEYKYNYQASTSYINVNATQYLTVTERYINNAYRYYYQNYEKLIGNLDNYYANTRQMLLVMQIDPYNYNIDTETEITLSLDVSGWTDSNGDQIRVDQKYMLTNIYQTIQDDWTGYINRQLTEFSAKGIINDIQNVDNNFYYSKVSTIEEIDETNAILKYDIGITPSKRNFIVIQLIPTIECSYYDFGQDQWENFGTNASTIPLNSGQNRISGIWINGTNVIPQGGTYEVIDIPGLMWEILTMPFAFVSQAFNLTLFPGTPYQLNIANLFLSIIAIVVFVWLISFFLKLKG